MNIGRPISLNAGLIMPVIRTSTAVIKMGLEIGIEERVREIQKKIPERDGALIPLLQRVQSDQGFISPEAIRAVAEELGVSESIVYGVATFYSEFKLFRPGKHHLKVCLGTSCYLRGGKSLINHLSIKLGIKPGKTTKDEMFSLETVACLGCCSRSPAMAIDDVIYGGVTIDQIDSLLVNLD
jgi:NADH:ubiquinone oxidoreductase subunit E